MLPTVLLSWVVAQEIKGGVISPSARFQFSLLVCPVFKVKVTSPSVVALCLSKLYVVALCGIGNTPSMLVRTNKSLAISQLCTICHLHQPVSVFVPGVRLLNFWICMKEVKHSSEPSPLLKMLWFYMILPTDAAQWFPTLFSEESQLEDLKVELCHLFLLASVLSHQMQISHRTPTQPRSLSLAFLLRAPVIFPN